MPWIVGSISVKKVLPVSFLGCFEHRSRDIKIKAQNQKRKTKYGGKKYPATHSHSTTHPDCLVKAELDHLHIK